MAITVTAPAGTSVVTITTSRPETVIEQFEALVAAGVTHRITGFTVERRFFSVRTTLKLEVSVPAGGELIITA